MKTLKKVLAVVLALAMVLGMTVTASAAFAGEEITYKEAVDVMNAVGVFVGDANGKMNPTEKLTRAAAAKLVAYLDLGEEVAEALPALAIFSDVKADHWAAKYVAYCADAGYVAGVGAGKYNPDGIVTGYEFAKLLLGVLGYDASVESMLGTNWQIAVSKLMQKTKIGKKLNYKGTALTREEAAQFCLEALQTGMVEYESKGTKVTINGATITTGATKADGTGESLMTHLYGGELVKTVATAAAGKDVLGRPAVKWAYNNKDYKDATGSYSVGTYATTADYKTVLDKQYTDKAALVEGIEKLLDVDSEDFLEDVRENDIDVYYNGLKKTGDAIGFVDGHINNAGVVLEFFLNDDDQLDTIVAYAYGVFKVTAVTKYDEDDTEYKKYGATVEYEIDDLTHPTAPTEADPMTYVDTLNDKGKNADGYQAIGSFEKNDKFMAIYNIDTKKFVNVQDVKTFEGKVSAASAGYVKVDGEKYLVLGKTNNDGVSFDTTLSFYVDPENTVVFAEEYEAPEAENYTYAYVEGIYHAGTQTNPSLTVDVMYTDGSEETFEYPVNKLAASGKLYAWDSANSKWAKASATKGTKYITLFGKDYVAKDVIAQLSSFVTPEDGVPTALGWVAVEANGEEITFIEGSKYAWDGEGLSATTSRMLGFNGRALTFAGLAGSAASKSVAMTSSTKLTLIKSNGSVKTYTGFTKIKSAIDELDGTVETLVVTNAKKDKVLEIYAYVGTAQTFYAEDHVYAIYTGTVGDTTEDGTSYAFYINGSKDYYTVDANFPELEKNAIYRVDVDKTELTYIAQDDLKDATIVAAADDDGIVLTIGGKTDNYELAEDYAAYKINNGKVSTYTTAKNDAVKVLLNSDDEVVYIFYTVATN